MENCCVSAVDSLCTSALILLGLGSSLAPALRREGARNSAPTVSPYTGGRKRRNGTKEEPHSTRTGLLQVPSAVRYGNDRGGQLGRLEPEEEEEPEGTWRTDLKSGVFFFFQI